MQSKKFKSFDELPLSLNAKQLIEVLGLSRSGVYNLFSDPTFPSIKIGKRIIVPKDKLLLWIDRKSSEKDV